MGFSAAAKPVQPADAGYPEFGELGLRSNAPLAQPGEVGVVVPAPDGTPIYSPDDVSPVVALRLPDGSLIFCAAAIGHPDLKAIDIRDSVARFDGTGVFMANTVLTYHSGERTQVRFDDFPLRPIAYISAEDAPAHFSRFRLPATGTHGS